MVIRRDRRQMEGNTAGGIAEIADVSGHAVAYPEPHDGDSIRSLCFARIETSDGHVGWGEAITGAPEASRAVNTILEDGLAPILIGEDPTRIAHLLERMRRRTFWYGTGGIATMAISAVDIALWDLAGKIAGAPVHRLLGGKLSDRVRLCASVIWDTEDLDATAEWFSSFRERGFTWVKAGWGRRPAEAAFGLDPERDVELLRTVREAIGPDVNLSVDVSIDAKWSVSHAIRMASRFEEFSLAWLEDALDFENRDGYARLRRAASMAIAAGEREWRPGDYQRLFDAGAVDIVLIDPGRVEGISGMKAAADLAARANVQFVPHSWSSAVNTAAALSVFSSSPNGLVFELKPDRSPMQHELVTNPFENEDGYLTVREVPGLGVEVDESALTEYRLD
jgi:L-alanine-DL-glutamate epimerase-like enolase superfamily enzyme